MLYSRMAWVAANIFVRWEAGELEPLLQALGELVESPAHRPERGGVLDAPPALVVSPPRDRWVVLIGLRGWLTDLPRAATELSRVDGATRAVSLELLGNCYRLRLSDSAEGKQRSLLSSPDGLDWQQTAHDGPMPLYRDVEQLAFATLLDADIPRELALIGARPADAEAHERVDLGEATCLEQGKRGLERSRRPLRCLAYDSDDAPLSPQSVGRDFGFALFDDRYVEGVPTDASVNRLIQLEEKLLDRARRLHGDRAQLTLTYYNGAYQSELDALLRARDRQVATSTRREHVPWWQFWRYFGRFK